MSTRVRMLIIFCATFMAQTGFSESMEIYCTLRAKGDNLNCQTLGKDRKVMSAEEVINFIDAAEVSAYITLKSRKGLERIYMIDPKAPQFERLKKVSKSASASQIVTAKADLFHDIEKAVIKYSDQQDAEGPKAELVLFDSAISLDKTRRDNRTLMAELEGYRKSKEGNCTSTPAFESMTKANARLQTTLSNIVYAFQTPDSCMATYKVFKDREGLVDLRQLDTVSDHFKANCRKK